MKMTLCDVCGEDVKGFKGRVSEVLLRELGIFGMDLCGQHSNAIFEDLKFTAKSFFNNSLSPLDKIKTDQPDKKHPNQLSIVFNKKPRPKKGGGKRGKSRNPYPLRKDELRAALFTFLHDKVTAKELIRCLQEMFPEYAPGTFTKYICASQRPDEAKLLFSDLPGYIEGMHTVRFPAQGRRVITTVSPRDVLILSTQVKQKAVPI